MRHTLLLFTALLLAPATAAADAVAYSCRDLTASDQVEVITDRGACTGFAVKDARGKVKRRVKFGMLASGVVVSSADGRRVALVQTNLYAGFDKGKLTSYGRKPVVDPPVVVLYRDGRKLAAHRIGKVLGRDRLVSLSTSHVRWVHSWKTMHDPLGDTFSFETTSFRTVTFDTRTGKLAAEDSETWKRCDAIAYGDVKPAGGAWEMKPAYVAKGPASKALSFETALRFGRRPGYKLLCFRRSAGKLEAIETINILLNGLTI